MVQINFKLQEHLIYE